eukprot:764485-Hanusia_phi.AAC.3
MQQPSAYFARIFLDGDGSSQDFVPIVHVEGLRPTSEEKGTFKLKIARRENERKCDGKGGKHAQVDGVARKQVRKEERTGRVSHREHVVGHISDHAEVIANRPNHTIPEGVIVASTPGRKRRVLAAVDEAVLVEKLRMKEEEERRKVGEEGGKWKKKGERRRRRTSITSRGEEKLFENGTREE